MTSPNSEALPRISRREALQWVMTASAAMALAPTSFGADAANPGAAPVTGKPYGTDPLLNHTYKPGDLWPLTLSAPQRQTVSALADVILPADDKSPAASAVGVTDFIDEWISAPYPVQTKDRATVLNGLDWLDAESKRLHGGTFTSINDSQKTALIQSIAHADQASADGTGGAAFFKTFRGLVMTGFFTTPAGMKDIGFVGNTPLTRFAEPPKEALQKLGLA